MSMPTVLIVDDDAATRFTLTHQLQRWQYRVLEAENGEQTLTILQHADVALILLDQMMPDCSGLDVFLQLNALFPTPPPAIMMTAYSSVELAVAFLKAGGTDFIQKPFEMSVVEVKIRQAIAAEEQQRRLRHELQKLSQVVEQSPSIVLITDLDGRIEYINPKCTTLTGYCLDEVIGKTPHLFSSNTHPHEFYRALWQTILAGQEWRGEFCNKKKDGTLYWEAAAISPIRNQAGEITHWLKVAEDITERKQAERAILEAKQLADDANRAKSDFLADISHELRTPLNGILGYTQILQRDDHLNNEQRRAIEVIHHSGEHLLLMINEILDLSKIEARRLELMPEPIHLPTFLANVVEIVRVRAQQKDLAFQAKLASDLPQGILADEKRLRQVLLNLLGNAIKFTTSGSITFNVSTSGLLPCSQHRAIAETLTGCHRIRFEIRDTGVGIPPEHLKEIFIPFHQVKDVRISKEEGTGLGLSICQQLVRLMGGEIEVISDLNKGSVFSFDLEFPVEDGLRDISPDVSELRPIGMAGAARRILIVDDVASNRALLRDMLSPVGFIIDEAENGKEAFDKTLAFRPDAILLDIVMPIMDGMSTVRHIREHPDVEDTVVIALSASVENRTREMSLAAGCNDYLTKPIRMTALFQKLETWLKIEWQYPTPSYGERQSSASSLIYPSLDTIGQLLRMAWQGDVIGIQETLRLLGEQDATLLPFVRIVEHFASNFQIEEMQDFLIQAVYDTYDVVIERKIHHPRRG
ncbi:signal transduction histidine kinase [Candidatus Moduliflexus flocculans]|uniref:Sensory/regulatory protein RpfC n=1 Tax=Candidatus Moduliflexus flocculans TaxID=1499966 RepID=A0A081BN30_9BACT|nr:signal transduction histidine kinase [Candidatus Moduliflexus flocculans]